MMGEVTWKGSHTAWNSGEFGCNHCLNKCVTDIRVSPTHKPIQTDLSVIYHEK